MQNLHATIKCELSCDAGELWFESVPDAVAACRRYFIGGGRGSCRIFQDDLIYTIDLSLAWNGKSLP